MKIFVAGATGVIGRSLLPMLIKKWAYGVCDDS